MIARAATVTTALAGLLSYILMQIRAWKKLGKDKKRAK